MKTITKPQRELNIIKKAVALGFEFDPQQTLEDILTAAEQYLIENAEAIEEECEVKSLGNHGQRVDWSDGNGYEYWSQGDIVNFSDHWSQPPSYKVFHTTVIDSTGNVINLFYHVGDTEYNAPEGYYYDSRLEKHVPLFH